MLPQLGSFRVITNTQGVDLYETVSNPNTQNIFDHTYFLRYGLTYERWCTPIQSSN